MAVQGPLTRSVRDARLALAAMAQGDPSTRDGPTCRSPARPCRGRSAWRWCRRTPAATPTRPRPRRCARPAGTSPPPATPSTRSPRPISTQIIETWHRIGSTDVLALLAPLMEEHGDADARTSMRLWLELAPPTDLRGVLGALAQRDLLSVALARLYAALSAGGDADDGRSAAAAQSRHDARGSRAGVGFAARQPDLAGAGHSRARRAGRQPRALCGQGSRFWLRASARICASMPARSSRRRRVSSPRSIR